MHFYGYKGIASWDFWARKCLFSDEFKRDGKCSKYYQGRVFAVEAEEFFSILIRLETLKFSSRDPQFIDIGVEYNKCLNCFGNESPTTAYRMTSPLLNESVLSNEAVSRWLKSGAFYVPRLRHCTIYWYLVSQYVRCNIIRLIHQNASTLRRVVLYFDMIEWSTFQTLHLLTSITSWLNYET